MIEISQSEANEIFYRMFNFVIGKKGFIDLVSIISLRFRCSEAKLGNYTFFNTYYLENHLHQRLRKLEYWLSMSSWSLG